MASTLKSFELVRQDSEAKEIVSSKHYGYVAFQSVAHKGLEPRPLLEAHDTVDPRQQHNNTCRPQSGPLTHMGHTPTLTMESKGNLGLRWLLRVRLAPGKPWNLGLLPRLQL
jgi:hypothetical protein